MRSLWGTVTEISDLGVVAEYCPHCERLMPCLLRSVRRGEYFLFVKMTEPPLEGSSLCTSCFQAFACVSWRYAQIVPVHEAKALPLEELLARTNPVLAEKLQFKEQVGALGGDARFAVAYEQLDAMRPGTLRSTLLRQLLDWDHLGEEQRTTLGRQIGARTRAWQFARQLAPRFPASAGCLTMAVSAFVAGAVFLCVPTTRSLVWGIVVVVAVLLAGAAINDALLTQRVARWTRNVLIPEAADANVSLDCFVAVVDDVPGSRLGLMEDLWPLKDQLDTIRRVLVAHGQLQQHL